MEIETWNMDRKQFEDQMDIVKAMVLEKLVIDGLIPDKAIADNWAATHTIKIENKTMWRTISDRWKKDIDKQYLIIVKRNG